MYNNRHDHIKEKDDDETGDILDNPNISRWEYFKYKFLQLQLLKPLIKLNVATQLEVYQSSMKYCFVVGQCLGLFPFMDITGKNVQNKYTNLFWRYILCIAMLLVQIIMTALTFYSLGSDGYTFTAAGYCLFFVTNLVSNIQFIRLSTKWHYLMELIAMSNLDEYVDVYLKFKCNVITIFFLMFGVFEHALSVICPFLKVCACGSDSTNILKKTSSVIYPWIFEPVLPYSLGAFVIVEFFIGAITLVWTYTHVFIICVSLFLKSIMEQLRKKIISHGSKYLPASHWQAVREDYNQAVRLVRFFDDEINGMIFVILGCSLFFICSRIYFLLGNNVSYGRSNDFECLHRQDVYSYEDFSYNLISGAFLICCSCTVLLVAAGIHSTSLDVAPSLYNVPSSSFCVEVQRFLEQIHTTTVALSGLNFFYVTKEFILSIFGSIVTYELVLMQFRREMKIE